MPPLGKTAAPTVAHAIQLLSEGTVRDDSTLPMSITYTLQDSSRYVVKCEYSNGTQTGEGESAVRAQWSSSNGIVCERGKSEFIS